MANIHETMDEQIGLAKTYAEDGAFFTAANKLRALADTVEKHAHACQMAEQAMDVNDLPHDANGDEDENVYLDDMPESVPPDEELDELIESDEELCSNCGDPISECQCDYR